MKARSLRSAILGIAALLTVVTGCRSSKKPADPVAQTRGKVNAEVREVVKDPERAAQVESLLQRALDSLKKTEQEEADYRARLRSWNANYDSTQLQLEAINSEHRTKLEALRKQSYETRDRIAAIVTDEEWKKLNSLRADIRIPDVQAN